jgi:hypothetical protein
MCDYCTEEEIKEMSEPNYKNLSMFHPKPSCIKPVQLVQTSHNFTDMFVLLFKVIDISLIFFKG